jgi:hypothetical protein
MTRSLRGVIAMSENIFSYKAMEEDIRRRKMAEILTSTKTIQDRLSSIYETTSKKLIQQKMSELEALRRQLREEMKWCSGDAIDYIMWVMIGWFDETDEGKIIDFPWK